MRPSKEILLELVEKFPCTQIAKQYKVSTEAVYYWLKSENILIKPRGYWHQFITKYNYNYKIFTNEDEISYYLLGVFLTDGCMMKNKASLSSADEGWLLSIRDLICPNKPLQKEKSKCWRLDISDFRIKKWLLDNECVPRKSLTLKFPSIPEQYIPDFMRGCIDGDGSISFNQYIRHVGKNNKPYPYYSIHYRLTSASKNFVDSFSSILYTNNLNHSISFALPGTNNSIINGRIIHHKNTIYTLAGGHKSAYNFLKWVYYPGHKISLERKKIRAEEIISHYESKI